MFRCRGLMQPRGKAFKKPPARMKDQKSSLEYCRPLNTDGISVDGEIPVPKSNPGGESVVLIVGIQSNMEIRMTLRLSILLNLIL
jgi:hypothetical protein